MAGGEHEPVVVIGAGAVGICCALSLLEAGEHVLLIDRDDPGGGASSGNAGIISPWSVSPMSVPGLWRNIPRWLLKPAGPLVVAPSYALKVAPWIVKFLKQGSVNRARKISDSLATLNHSNVELYRRHLAGTGAEHLIVDSYYVHAYRQANKASLQALEYQLRVEKGGDLDVIGTSELTKLEPALSSEFKAAVLIKGQARARSPGEICQILAQKFAAHGGEIVKELVSAIVPHGDGMWRIETPAKSIMASRVVLAAGAWSAQLLEPLGLSVPLEAERGYHVEFSNPGVTLNHSVMDVDLKCVASSMTTGLRVAGTSEFAGLDKPANAKRIAILTRQAQRILPDLNTTQVEQWMGVRPSTPDSLPFLGQVPGQKGLFAAFGHSHYGLMMAPRTGGLIADIMTGRQPNIDLDPYRFDRFQLEDRGA